MPEHHQIGASRSSDSLKRHIAQAHTIVFRTMYAAGFRCTQRQSRPEVGVYQLEGPHRKGVPENRFHKQIPTVRISTKPVTVFHFQVPAASPDAQRRGLVLHADHVAQHGTTPAVVVPGDPMDCHARGAKFRHRAENRERKRGNRAAPFEPEIENVAIQDQ